jgi:hypothetical protein
MNYDPASRSTADLLCDWASVMRELRARDIIRTNNNPVGDIAEAVVHAHYGGERAGFSNAGWDVKTPAGERLEVKALRVAEGGKAGRGLSPIRQSDYDAVIVVVFNEDFEVTEGLRIPREVVEERFAVEAYRNARSIRLTQALRADPRVETVDLSDAYAKLST